MLFAIVCLLIASSCLVNADTDFDVVVKLENGGSATIRGIKYSYGYGFDGIRFAQPSVGDRRWKYAERLDPEGLVIAQKFGSSCEDADDCLYINVHVPLNTNFSDPSLPVYMYIYGGGFVGGNGNWGGEDLFKGFINKGPLVFVTINYRLGPMGFFTTRDPNAPGNFAISDWVEGLNWIHRYIKFFGGNANRLTIGGQSSGGEAVSTLSLTPVAKGLFNQMIIESGSAFGAALMSYSDRTRNTSLALAMQLGCATGANQWNSNNFPQIMSCLRSKSFSEVKTADDKLPNHRMKWALVQDNLYLPDRLENLAMQRPQLPVVIGDVHDEWMAWDMYFIQHNINSSLATRQGVKDSLKNSYEITYWDNVASVLNGATQAYNFDHEQFADDDHVNWLALHMQLWTEMVFIGPVLRDARYFAYTGSPTYLYSFDYLSPLAYPDITYPQLRGVPHGWEMPYIYNTYCNGYTCQPEDNELHRVTSGAFVNFVVTGNPTPATGGINVGFNWPKLDNSNQNSFVSFISPQVKVGPGFHPVSMYWACTAPTIDGYKPPFAC